MCKIVHIKQLMGSRETERKETKQSFYERGARSIRDLFSCYLPFKLTYKKKSQRRSKTKVKKSEVLKFTIFFLKRRTQKFLKC